MPEISVGRLAVNSLDEALTVVNKIVGYDEGMRTAPWQQRALFVADNADSAGDFPGLSNQIIADYLPADVVPTRVYLGITHPNASSAKDAIRGAINAGTWMVQYSGHGAPERWAHEYIVARLSGDKRALFLTPTGISGRINSSSDAPIV